MEESGTGICFCAIFFLFINFIHPTEIYIVILDPVHARKLSRRDDEDNVILLPVARCTPVHDAFDGRMLYDDSFALLRDIS
jgi:hypothetical protein